jgi:hypothetical protein
MKTTLHNHVKLGTEEKPLIPNKEFKTLMWLVKNKMDYKHVLDKYTLTKFQTDLIKQYE